MEHTHNRPRLCSVMTLFSLIKTNLIIHGEQCQSFIFPGSHEDTSHIASLFLCVTRKLRQPISIKVIHSFVFRNPVGPKAVKVLGLSLPYKKCLMLVKFLPFLIWQSCYCCKKIGFGSWKWDFLLRNWCTDIISTACLDGYRHLSMLLCSKDFCEHALQQRGRSSLLMCVGDYVKCEVDG